MVVRFGVGRSRRIHQQRFQHQLKYQHPRRPCLFCRRIRGTPRQAGGGAVGSTGQLKYEPFRGVVRPPPGTDRVGDHGSRGKERPVRQEGSTKSIPNAGCPGGVHDYENTHDHHGQHPQYHRMGGLKGRIGRLDDFGWIRGWDNLWRRDFQFGIGGRGGTLRTSKLGPPGIIAW